MKKTMIILGICLVICSVGCKEKTWQEKIISFCEDKWSSNSIMQTKCYHEQMRANAKFMEISLQYDWDTEEWQISKAVREKYTRSGKTDWVMALTEFEVELSIYKTKQKSED